MIPIKPLDQVNGLINSLPDSWEKEKLALRLDAKICSFTDVACALELMEECQIASGIRRTAMLSTFPDLWSANMNNTDRGHFWLGRVELRALDKEDVIDFADSNSYI